MVSSYRSAQTRTLHAIDLIYTRILPHHKVHLASTSKYADENYLLYIKDDARTAPLSMRYDNRLIA